MNMNFLSMLNQDSQREKLQNTTRPAYIVGEACLLDITTQPSTRKALILIKSRSY
jgi:hypothetical protein